MDPRFYVLTPAGLSGPYANRSEAEYMSGPYANRYEAEQSARRRFPVIVRTGERAADEPRNSTCPRCGRGRK